MSDDNLIGVTILAIFLTMVAVERIRPSREFPAIPHWFWIGTATILVMFVINILVQVVIPEEWVSRHSLFDVKSWGIFPSAVFGVLMVSFVDYWFHRGEHRLNFLWRIHQLHHSPDRMDINGFVYTHPLEVLILSLESVVVTRFIFGLAPAAVVIVTTYTTFCFMFQHWNVRTPTWMGYIVQRPESHCIHHQINYHASNYSNVPFWDILFGTFKNPESFTGQVGFVEGRGHRVREMLLLKDVNSYDVPPAAARRAGDSAAGPDSATLKISQAAD